jgi:hypothetical protein
MIGLLITSFLQGKLNLTTTSTIFSPYVDHVMEESRIAYFNGLRGETPGINRGGVGMGRVAQSNRGGVKTVGGRVLRVLNDLLPYKLRPIKAKRVANRKRWGVGVELYTMRMRWHSHGKYEARKLKNKLQFWKK